jgi:hypothetical protein
LVEAVALISSFASEQRGETTRLVNMCSESPLKYVSVFQHISTNSFDSKFEHESSTFFRDPSDPRCSAV